MPIRLSDIAEDGTIILTPQKKPMRLSDIPDTPQYKDINEFVESPLGINLNQANPLGAKLPIGNIVKQFIPQTAPAVDLLDKTIRQANLNMINSALGGALRPISRSFGYDIPTPETMPEKIAAGVGSTVGTLGGIPGLTGLKASNVAGRIATQSKLLNNVVRGAAGLGTMGLLETPQRVQEEGTAKDLLAFPERLKQGAAGAAIGGTVGGAIGATSGIIKGAKNIINKGNPGYLKTKIVPEAYSEYQKNLNNFTEGIQTFAKKSLNMPENVINTLKNKGIENVSKVRQVYNDSTDDIYRNIELGFERKRELANKAYSEAMQNTPKNFGGTINVKETLNKMKNVFRGSLGEATRGQQGNRLYQIMEELEKRKPAPKGFYGDRLPTNTQIQRNLRGEKLEDIAGEVRLSTKQFNELRDALNSLYRENPYDRNIAKVMNQLYDDGENSGLKGLQEARKLQREAFQAEEMLNKKSLIGQRKLDNFQKLTNEEKRQLQEVEKYTGVNFIDDLDSITAARYADKLTQYNMDRFASDLNSAMNPANTEYIKNKYSGLLGEKTSKVFNDIEAHRKATKTLETGKKFGKTAAKWIGAGIAAGAGLKIGKRFLD